MGFLDRLMGVPSEAERHRLQQEANKAEFEGYIAQENAAAQRSLDKARVDYPAALAEVSAAPSAQVDAAVQALWTLSDSVMRTVDEPLILARVATWKQMAVKQLEPGERILGLHHQPRADGKKASHTLITSQGFIVRQGVDVFRLGPQKAKVHVDNGSVHTETEWGSWLFDITFSPGEVARFALGLAVAIELQAAAIADEEKAKRVTAAGTVAAKKAARKRSSVRTPTEGAAQPLIKPAPRLMRSARDAELVAVDWMVYMGFLDAAATNLGPDGGIDVQAKGAAAQVKLHGKPIGRPPLQQLRGAARPGDTLLFFSLTGYTPQGLGWADEVGMALFAFDLQGEPEPVNAAARKLLPT